MILPAIAACHASLLLLLLPAFLLNLLMLLWTSLKGIIRMQVTDVLDPVNFPLPAHAASP